MHANRWLKLSLFSLLFVALPLMAMQQPVRPPLEDAPTLPNDFMPAAPTADLQPGAVTDASYEVAPILFVPAGVTPVSNGLDYVNRTMDNVRHWYAEILDGHTFSLTPAELVIGQHPLTYYFGNCYPPVDSSACNLGATMWGNVFAELDSRGYSLPANLVQGIFFQGEGFSTALGGGRRFLVGFNPDSLFPDCLQPGCANNVSLGGAAHELGHAFGLPHPDGDPQYGVSVMGVGLYSFPQTTFINSPAFPEYDQLLASPFINVDLPLSNPGFEGCLTGWNVTKGAPSCVQSGQLSGLNALHLDSAGRTRLNQAFELNPGGVYDFSGWVNAATLPAGASITIQLDALRANSTVAQTFTITEIDQSTDGWTRVAASLQLPADASKGELWISTQQVAGIDATLDDLNLASPAATLPAPLIATAFDGDAVATDRPLLHWSPVASAVSYDVQVAADPFFESPLADASGIVNFAYQPPALPYNMYSYWRVRAVNGAGVGDWSPVWSVIPREPADFYNDEFEASTLSDAWSFVREDPAHWRIGGIAGRRWDGYFVVDLQPGDLEMTNDARNLLLRAMPQGDLSLETLVNFWYPLSANYQQGGLIIYQDDDNYIRLGHVFRDGMRIEYEAEINGVIQERSDAWMVDTPRLRIERRGNVYTAAYSASGVDWTPLGQPVTVDWPNARMGLAAYAGPATQLPSAALNWFRVTDPCLAVTVASDPVGSGSVSTAGAGCGDGRFRPGSPLRLTATAAPGYAFDHWSGAAAGDANPLEIDATGDLAVTAHFRTVNPAAPDLYLSPEQPGNVGGIAITPQDIIKRDGATGAWSLYFDGSDVGITSPIAAFARLQNGDLLLVFRSRQAISDVGTFNARDVARFSPVSLGDATAGSFHWYFDGSDVGLQGGREQIDALEALPDGRLLISTTGTAAVPNGGNVVRAQDEDLLAFTPTTLGETTAGSWALYLDGTAIPGLARKDVSGAAVDSANGDIYITIDGNYRVGGVRGNGKDILLLHPVGDGYSVARYWHGPDDGFRPNIGGLEIGGD